MRATVVGGGNIGTQFAAHLAAAGHEVTVSASKADKFEQRLKVIDGAGVEVVSGEIAVATTDDKVAFSSADMVFVTIPAFCMEEVATQRLLCGHGLLVKDLSGKIDRDGRQFLRVAVRGGEDNARLVEALREVLDTAK